MKFTKHYTVRWHDTDCNRCVRPTKILMYMQETAGEHLKSLLMSMDDMRDRLGLAFLLSSISVSIYEPLYADDEIDVQTWVCESRGLGYNRCFCIIRNGKTVAEASSVWGLLDLRTHRLLRADESPFEAKPDAAVALDLPRRLRMVRIEEMEAVGERTIVYSDIDYNGHMNNTHYPDLFCDFTPDICQSRVCAMMLSFLHEGTFGHTLKIYRKKTENGYLFRTVDGEGVTCTEALLRTEPFSK
ncbi:MAG: hypothetical protein IJX80_00505 [Clostridia bacterium]|nr:hypothetical protein [Clostridia bacterium]